MTALPSTSRHVGFAQPSGSNNQLLHRTCLKMAGGAAIAIAEPESFQESWGRLVAHSDFRRKSDESGELCLQERRFVTAGSLAAVSASTSNNGELLATPWSLSVANGYGLPLK